MYLRFQIKKPITFIKQIIRFQVKNTFIVVSYQNKLVFYSKPKKNALDVANIVKCLGKNSELNSFKQFNYTLVETLDGSMNKLMFLWNSLEKYFQGCACELFLKLQVIFTFLTHCCRVILTPLFKAPTVILRAS